MEEKEKDLKTSSQENINLCLTFNPEQMQQKISDLSEQVKQLKMENEMLNLIVTDAEIEIASLQNKIPKSWLTRIQDILLDWFGGNYEN